MIYVPYNEEQESGTTGVQSRNNLSQNQTNQGLKTYISEIFISNKNIFPTKMNQGLTTTTMLEIKFSTKITRQINMKIHLRYCTKSHKYG